MPSRSLALLAFASLMLAWACMFLSGSTSVRLGGTMLLTATLGIVGLLTAREGQAKTNLGTLTREEQPWRFLVHQVVYLVASAAMIAGSVIHALRADRW